MCGWQVKLCDPIVRHGPHLSASEIKAYNIAYNKALDIFISLLFFFKFLPAVPKACCPHFFFPGFFLVFFGHHLFLCSARLALLSI